MTQVSMRGFVSKAFDVSITRPHRLSLLLCVPMLLLAVVPAWASPGRMVSVNVSTNPDGTQKGQLHRILRNLHVNPLNFQSPITCQLEYARGHADKDWSFDDSKDPITVPALTAAWPSCFPGNPQYMDNSDELFAAEGIAVFDNKIWVAYTALADSTKPSTGLAAYLSAFDLTPTDDAADGHWTLFSVPNAPAGTPQVQYETLGPGSAHVDTPAVGYGSGAAITVFNQKDSKVENKFNNQLYVFTDNGVYTSGDGITWTYHNRPFSINALLDKQHEPLDAVTINTPDGQRILIVYGYVSGTHNYYDHVDVVDWNGQFGSASQARIYNGGGGCVNDLYDPNDKGWCAPNGSFRARVSLTVGTKASGNGLGAGALAPAVQLFGQTGEQLTSSNHNPARHAEYVYTTIANGWGTWTWDGRDHEVQYFDHVNPSLMVYPGSTFQCDSNNVDMQAMEQYIVLLGGFNWWTTKTPFVFGSDFLKPRHERNTACTYVDSNGKTQNVPPPIGTLTNTNTDDMSSYWTLVGVVLGSPPFSRNGISDTDTAALAALSNVEMKQDETKKIETTSESENSLSVSVGHKVTAGLFDMLHISKSFDASYKHTWEKESGTTSTVGISIDKTYGTSTVSDPAALGTFGWLVFTAPHVYVQDWTVYGYDYLSGGPALSFLPGVDCSLDSSKCLDLQTVSIQGSPDYLVRSFDLKTPSASGPLFAGMGSFGYQDIYNNDANLDYWQGPYWYPNDSTTKEPLDWQNDERWETRAGDGGTTHYACKSGDQSCQYITKLISCSASQDHSTYSIEKETMTGHGHTNDVEIKAGESMGADLKLKGFGVGMENSISVGYGGKFSWNTKTTTGIGSSITATLTVPGCGLSRTDCYQNIDVQPYWLHAVAAFTDHNPWIPDRFKGQTPWLLTWIVTGACKYGDIDCTAGAARTGSAGLIGFSGTALPPDNAFGRIVNGNGGDDGGAPYSHYVIQGGRLAWVNNNGGERRIPMTADDFVPSKGVTIEVAGGSWSSSGSGSWKRNGETWTFQTNPSAKPSVSLSLDFGSATYDLNIQQADLNGRMLAGVTNARLVLGVNQLYKFYTLLQHDVDITWRWSKPPADNLTSHVTSFSGRYNSTNQSGKMSIVGTLPANLPEFGDVEIDVNDHPYIVRLITMDGFQEAFETGGVVRYSKAGLILVIDFGKKTWSATFNQKAFQSLAPKWGSVRAVDRGRDSLVDREGRGFGLFREPHAQTVAV